MLSNTNSFQLLNELHPGLDFSFFSGGENNYDCKVNIYIDSMCLLLTYNCCTINFTLLHLLHSVVCFVFKVTVEELTFASKGRKNKKEAKKGVAMEALSTLYNVVYPPGSQFAS